MKVIAFESDEAETRKLFPRDQKDQNLFMSRD